MSRDDPGTEPEDVPAGGAGADTGAVGAARVDPTDRAEIPNVSSQNDAPGVGTRGAGSPSSSELNEDDARLHTESDGESADSRSRPTDPALDTPELQNAGASIEELEPGVDPESARTSKVVRSADLSDL